MAYPFNVFIIFTLVVVVMILWFLLQFILSHPLLFSITFIFIYTAYKRYS